MVFIVLSLLGGTVFLALGTQGIVTASLLLARGSRLPAKLAGLTASVLAGGLPGLAVGLQAAHLEGPQLALGGVVGAAIFNLLAVMGLTAIIAPIGFSRSLRWADLFPITLIFTAAAIGMLVVGNAVPPLPHWAAVAPLGLLVVYAAITARVTRPFVSVPALAGHKKLNPVITLALLAGGIIALSLGTNLLTDGANQLIRNGTLSPVLAGLGVLALGITAGNLVGLAFTSLHQSPQTSAYFLAPASMFSLLGTLAGIILFADFSPAPQTFPVIPLLVLASAAFAVLALSTGKRLGRTEGCLLFTGYLIFIWYAFLTF